MNNSSQISVTADTLTGIELFRGLSGEERTRIATHCKVRHYSSQQQIFSQKDPSHDVYFIVSGLVRVTYFSKSGKEITFRDQVAGEMFGELSAIDGLARSAHVMALSDVVLISLSPDDFLTVRKEYPAIAEKIMQHLVNLVRLLSDRVVEFSALSVNGRIHVDLLRLSDKDESSNTAIIAPIATHAEIASRISSHREAVTRELNALEQAGLLERQHDKWIITDLKRLQKMVRDVLGE